MSAIRSWTKILFCVALGCDGAPIDGDVDGGNDPARDGATRADAYRPLPRPIDAGPLADTCGLEDPAFCETFETPSPGGRGGDLDESTWSFARWGHEWGAFWVRVPATSRDDVLFRPTFCGELFEGILPGDDVRTCEGIGADGQSSNQLNEVFDDAGDFGINSMRARQLFDFTEREGRLVWDVDAKYNPHNLGHGWWIEVWITEDPAPIPYHEAPTVASLPRNGVGFAFRFGGACGRDVDQWANSLENVHVIADHQFVHAYDGNAFEYETDWPSAERCFRVEDGRLNHFELRITRDRAELWASDYDDLTTMRRRVVVPNLDLDFSRGYVHFQHAHYNAIKDGLVLEGQSHCEEPNCPTPSQTFRWDNIGFDGPRYPTPRAYDIEDDDTPGGTLGGVRLGYPLADGAVRTFTVRGVDTSDAIAASFNFSGFDDPGDAIEVRFNGGAWHRSVTPLIDGLFMPDNTALRSMSIAVPLEELREGDNTIEVRALAPDFEEGIGNADLTIEVSR
jgi:hypothetical protein